MPVPSGDVDALVRAGRYEEAAQQAVANGDLTRAIMLLDRVWRFADAVPLAEALGDVNLAVRLALDARDPTTARRLAASQTAPALLGELSATFAARGHLDDAALLAERAGGFAQAARLHDKAGDLVAAGRAWELAGELRAAAESYDRVLRAGSDDESDLETASARLALGRLLLRTGRPLEATRALQRASRNPVVAPGCWQPLCAALLAVGLRHAAAEIARRMHADRPGTPETAEAIAAREVQGSSAAVDRFRVIRLLGAGSAGRVYLAEDRLLGREVALKAVSVGGANAEREALQRFLREAEAIARLKHPHVVAVHDIDAWAGLLVLEYLPGGTLGEALAGGRRLSPAAARRLALELLGALGAAHEAGLIHRDVKPANVFFDAAGGAKLGDFGAAHLLDFGQTQTGGFIGTLAYLSPEQITGERIGPAADLYGLGVTLFEALTGRPPFLGPDFVAQHLGERPPSVSELEPTLSAAHDQVLARALAKDPAQRFSSAAAMATAVRSWPTERSVDGPARPAPAPAGAPSREAPADPGPYDVTAELGATGRGRLLRARDPRLGREVVLERLDRPLNERETEALRWVANAGGPDVQRVLGLAADGLTISYELVEGQPAAEQPPPTALQELPAPHSARAVITDAGTVWLVQPASTAATPAPAPPEPPAGLDRRS